MMAIVSDGLTPGTDSFQEDPWPEASLHLVTKKITYVFTFDYVIKNYKYLSQVCRVRTDHGELLPGRLARHSIGCLVTTRHLYIIDSTYQTLWAPRRARPMWIRKSNGDVPHCANPSGWTENGGSLYTGRHHPRGRNDDYFLGKIDPRKQRFYYFDGNREQESDNYEALCVDDRRSDEDSTDNLTFEN